VAVIAAQPLIEALSSGGLFYLVAGGICYTIGALFYSINKLSYNHAIFHVWVLAGSIFHFVSIFFYVL
jgi:hemolysin III